MSRNVSTYLRLSLVSNRGECFFFGDIGLLTIAVVLAVRFCAVAHQSLLHVNDAFKLRKEMERVMVPGKIFSGVRRVADGFRV